MNSLESLATFFGWCAVLNIGFLLLTVLMVMLMRDFMTGMHSRIFGVNEADLPAIYFRYMAHYQSLTLVFSVMPWIALKIMM